MYKSLIAALLLAAGACAHAPVKAPEPPKPVAAVAPCVATPPPEVRKHPLMFMVKPEETKVVTPDGEEVEVLNIQADKVSVLDFFLHVKLLDDWAQDAWKSCGAGAR